MCSIYHHVLPGIHLYNIVAGMTSNHVSHSRLPQARGSAQQSKLNHITVKQYIQYSAVSYTYIADKQNCVCNITLAQHVHIRTHHICTHIHLYTMKDWINPFPTIITKIKRN